MQSSINTELSKGKTLKPTPPVHLKARHPSPMNIKSRQASSTTATLDSNELPIMRGDSRVPNKDRHSYASRIGVSDVILKASESQHLPRPQSSMSRYDVLPQIHPTPETKNLCSISNREFKFDLLTPCAQQMKLDRSKWNLSDSESNKPGFKDNSKPRRNENNCVNKSSLSPKHISSRTEINQPASKFDESNKPHNKTNNHDSSEIRWKLALKLPDGGRVEHWFSPSNTLHEVMQFSQQEIKFPLSNCNVYSMLQVPKFLLRNWKLTLEQLCLGDRTVLYIEEDEVAP